MRNKIASEYEKKRWYRVFKSLYVIFFGIFLLIGNLLIFTDRYNVHKFRDFLLVNIGIVFLMGAIEGLFWYIVRGKWGYPKDNEQ